MCINFIYDLNGNKGPNTAGKDIGIITVFNAIDPTVVAPFPSRGEPGYANCYGASKVCTTKDSQSRLPNIIELSALHFNRELVNPQGIGHHDFWSSSIYSTDKAWFFSLSGQPLTIEKSRALFVRCIQR